jgi:Ca2+/Na+ antiporter
MRVPGVSGIFVVFMPMIMVVVVIVMIMPVIMVMPATSVIVIMLFVLGMIVLVLATIRLFGSHGDEIEQREDDEPDARNQHHGLEDALALQILGDAAGGVEVKHHAAPQ